MVNRNQPADRAASVREAFDLVRVTMPTISEWLRKASSKMIEIPPSTLNNYRDGRRKMPFQLRVLFANVLRKHAAEIEIVATKLVE